jgi:hypothetical protein
MVELVLELFDRGGIRGEIGIAAAFGFEGALLEFVFSAALELGNGIAGGAPQRFVGLVDPDFAAVERGAGALKPVFGISFLVLDAFRLGAGFFLGCALKSAQLGRGPGAEFSFQLFFASGKILDERFELIQQREHLVDTRYLIHNRS